MSDAGDAVLRPRIGAADPVGIASTTRRGGLGTGPAATLALGGRGPGAAIDANRRRLAEALGLAASPVWLRQVHGTECVELTGAEPPAILEADAAWTRTPGVACAVLAADCLPVVLADRGGRAVAVAHAGWRGLAGGVLERAVASLPVDARALLAWLGPAIGPAAFEVGPEVRAAFTADDPGAAAAFRRGRADRWFGDLYALARRRLHRAGVATVLGGGRCTVAESSRFFSHRRDGACAGRMATLAWLDPSGSARRAGAHRRRHRPA